MHVVIVDIIATEFHDSSHESHPDHQLQDGDLMELLVWHVSKPVPPCAHNFKYRLVYLVSDTRVIGYDNGRGKGDHRHVAGEENEYTFTSVDLLIEDFIAEVEQWKSGH